MNQKTRNKAVGLPDTIIAEIEERIGAVGIMNWSAYLRQLALKDLERRRKLAGVGSKP